MLLRYARKIRYLSWRQLAALARRRLFGYRAVAKDVVTPQRRMSSGARPFLPHPPSGSGAEHFRFLNHSEYFPDGRVDWKALNVSKLWRYNLHYFDYILDPCRSESDIRTLISDWIAQNPPGTADAWEPYTVSMRIVNWVKFVLTRSAGDSIPGQWLSSLCAQALDRKSTRLNSSHTDISRMPSSA